jgi:glutamine amidotransferase
MIAVIDYGMGNLRSVQKALERVGGDARLVRTPQELSGAQKIVFPGVAAFGDAMEQLRIQKLVEPIIAAVRAGTPYLGFCLGLQLLFETGTEDGEHKGLGILGGKVVKFDFGSGCDAGVSPACGEGILPSCVAGVPPASFAVSSAVSSSAAAGQQQKQQQQDADKMSATHAGGTPAPHTQRLRIPHMGWNQIHWNRDCPMLRGIEQGAYAYFAHSYYPVPADPSITVTTTDYGYNFTSSVWKDNIFATQFHPEKSQAVGLKLLENFVNL